MWHVPPLALLLLAGVCVDLSHLPLPVQHFVQLLQAQQPLNPCPVYEWPWDSTQSQTLLFVPLQGFPSPTRSAGSCRALSAEWQKSCLLLLCAIRLMFCAEHLQNFSFYLPFSSQFFPNAFLVVRCGFMLQLSGLWCVRQGGCSVMSGVFSHLSPDLPSLSSQALLSRFQKPHSGADLPRICCVFLVPFSFPDKLCLAGSVPSHFFILTGLQSLWETFERTISGALAAAKCEPETVVGNPQILSLFLPACWSWAWGQQSQQFSGGASWERSWETSSCDEVKVAGGKITNVKRKSLWVQKDVFVFPSGWSLVHVHRTSKSELHFIPCPYVLPLAVIQQPQVPFPLSLLVLWPFLCHPSTSHCWSTPSQRARPDKPGTQQGKAMIMKKNRSKQACHLPACVSPDSAARRVSDRSSSLAPRSRRPRRKAPQFPVKSEKSLVCTCERCEPATFQVLSFGMQISTLGAMNCTRVRRLSKGKRLQRLVVLLQGNAGFPCCSLSRSQQF